MVLLNMVCMVTLIKGTLVSEVRPVTKNLFVYVHEDAKTYPLVTMSNTTNSGIVEYKVRLVRNLERPVKVECDFPRFWELWNKWV